MYKHYDPDFLLYKTISLLLLVISSCVNPSKQVINFMGYHWKSSTIVQKYKLIMHCIDNFRLKDNYKSHWLNFCSSHLLGNPHYEMIKINSITRLWLRILLEKKSTISILRWNTMGVKLSSWIYPIIFIHHVIYQVSVLSVLMQFKCMIVLLI